jgi:hypothetical protein
MVVYGNQDVANSHPTRLGVLQHATIPSARHRRWTVTLALCFALGALIGWLGHKAEVEQEKRKSAALAKVFERKP